MRSSTSRALGFLFVALSSVTLGSACSSSSDSSGAAPPPFSGTVSANTGSGPSAGVDDTTGASATDTAGNNSAGSQQTAGSSTPSSSNEGAPNVTQLTPSQPAANAGSNSGSGGASGSSGAMQAQGSAGQAASAPQGAAGQAATPPTGQPATGNTQVFLLFGQSNMYGVPAPEQQDLTINPHVEVLTITKCAKHDVNQWVPAQPPLHGCVGMPSNAPTGPGVGPGDYFAKTLSDAFPNDTILLVPGAVPGVSIDTFQRGQTNYNNLLARAKMAQQRGPIRGMIFHQGENDSGQPDWPMRVKSAVTALRADLNIGDVPFVAGELLYSPPGCCGTQHNPLVDMLPSVITNSAIVKTNDLTALTKAQDTFGIYHFNLPSQRTLGQRYGQAMLGLLGKN